MTTRSRPKRHQHKDNEHEVLKDVGCDGPLADGSQCHACRVLEALFEAEAVLGHNESDNSFDEKKCQAALLDVLVLFMAENKDETTLGLVIGLYYESRRRREHLMESEDKSGSEKL
jgi:hypothetical protein